jgi:hypothetical protein
MLHVTRISHPFLETDATARITIHIFFYFGHWPWWNNRFNSLPAIILLVSYYTSGLVYPKYRPPIQWVPEWQGRESYLLTPARAEVKNVWTIPPLPARLHGAVKLIKQRPNFAFTSSECTDMRILTVQRLTSHSCTLGCSRQWERKPGRSVRGIPR